MWLLLSSIALSADVAWYADTDSDGFGDGGVFIIADQDALPLGYVRSDTDCNDNNDDVSPSEQESCNGFDDDCDGVIDGEAVCSLCTYGMFEDHQYAVCGIGGGTDFRRNWDFARGFCTSIPYDLVSITSSEEDAYVLGRVRAADPSRQYWIGLTDRGSGNEGNFSWSDGSEYTASSYDNWAGGEPNNAGNEDCVTTNYNSPGEWNDNSCFATAPFVCEAVGDPRLWWPDMDGDGFGDITGRIIEAHAQPFGYAANAADCDDDNTQVQPGAVELCNGIDDNCNDIIDRDSGLFLTVYSDPDGDGFGSGDSFETCVLTEGLSAVGTDCGEGDASIFPGADEFCNGADNDCDGTPDNDALDRDEWYADGDGDGYGSGRVQLACAQPPGAVLLDGDCDDSNPARTPNADEVCDGIDNDCDEIADNDSIDLGTWFVDADDDNFGDSETTVSACDQPDGSTVVGGDCDDDDSSTYPGAPELEDGIDNDCDGFPEDVDPDTDTDDPDTDTGDLDTDETVTSSRQFDPGQPASVVPSGCSCSAGTRNRPWWAALGLVGLLAAVRRRSLYRG
jgi:MYXO-CTERM domain-containing protein